MQTMTIGKLAQAGGVGVETIRYYQRRGLLCTPVRQGGDGFSGGVRRYGAEDLRRLRFIRSAQTAGFSLEEIGELLDLDSSADRERAHQLAMERIAALDEKILALQQARRALDQLARDCAGRRKGPCPILAAFQPD